MHGGRLGDYRGHSTPWFDSPDDDVFLAVGRDHRRGAGISELQAGRCNGCELPVLDGVVAQVVAAGGEEDVAVPINRSATIPTL